MHGGSSTEPNITRQALGSESLERSSPEAPLEAFSGLGRVAVVAGGAGAPRVLRALREAGRAGQANQAVVLHGPDDRQARLVREADEALELEGSIEDAL